MTADTIDTIDTLMARYVAGALPLPARVLVESHLEINGAKPPRKNTPPATPSTSSAAPSTSFAPSPEGWPARLPIEGHKLRVVSGRGEEPE